MHTPSLENPPVVALTREGMAAGMPRACLLADLERARPLCDLDLDRRRDLPPDPLAIWVRKLASCLRKSSTAAAEAGPLGFLLPPFLLAMVGTTALATRLES